MQTQTSIAKSFMSIGQDFYRKMIDAPRKALKAFQEDGVTIKDFKYTNEVDSCENIFETYEQEKKSHPSRSQIFNFMFLMLKKIKTIFVMTFTLSLIVMIFEIIKPLTMKSFLDFTNPSSEKSYENLIKCVGAFVLISFIESVLSNYRHALNNTLHLNMHHKIKVCIFEKFMRLSSASKKNLETGVLLNQYRSDTGDQIGLFDRAVFVLVDCGKFFTCSWYMYKEIGNVSLIFPVLMILCIFIKTLWEGNSGKFFCSTRYMYMSSS